MQIPILAPDVNESGKTFVATTRGIRFALTAIKGVGEGVVEVILGERKKSGPFSSLYDFLSRIDTRKVGKKVIEVLILAGAFDFTGWDRQQLTLSVEPMYNETSAQQKESLKGVMNLLSLIEEDRESRFLQPPEVEERLPQRELLKKENELLGFYLTGHPMDSYRKHFQKLSCVPLSHVEGLEDGTVLRCAGIIETIQTRISAKSQRKFAILTIGDGMDRYELPVWPDLYAAKGELLQENQLIYAVLQIEKRGGSLKLQCRFIDDLTKVDEAMITACDAVYERYRAQVKNGERREKKMRSKTEDIAQEKPSKLLLSLDADAIHLSQVLELKNLFRSFPGPSAVTIEYYSGDSIVGVVGIAPPWGVEASSKLEEKIKKLTTVLSYRTEKL